MMMTCSGGLATEFAKVAAEIPDEVAISYYGDAVAYGDLDAQSRRMAANLRRMGIGRGDRVAIWLPNTPAWLICFLAVARLGAIALATNTRFRQHELADILPRSGARAIVCWPGYRGIDFAGILRSAAEALGDLKDVIVYGEKAGPQDRGQMLPGRSTTAYHELLVGAPMDEDFGGDDAPCILFTTSGTSSRPKLVLHSQLSVFRHARDAGRALGYVDADASVLQVIPFCGAFGFAQAMATLFAGKHMELQHTFDPELAVRSIIERRVTVAAATDEMIRRIYAAAKEERPFPNLKLLSGSRAGELVELSRSRGFTLIGMYGSSEVNALFSRRLDTDSPEQRAIGGGFPVTASVRVRAVDPDGETLPHGEPGELEIHSPNVAKAYFGDPAATAKAFTEDGFFRTGDTGFTAADGSFTFLYRTGDSLRLNGFLVNPAEIESSVATVEGVSACHVVGITLGPRTAVAAFYSTPDGKELPELMLLSHCATSIAPYKVPDRFFHVREFPMANSANTQKVNKEALRTFAREHMKQGS